MQSNWKLAFEQMLASEGGFTDDERDNGNKLPDGRKGSTMLGVTQFNWEQHVGHQVTHDDMRKLTPADVSVLYVEPDGTRSIVREMPLNVLGELVKSWPGGFFEEGLREQFGDA